MAKNSKAVLLPEASIKKLEQLAVRGRKLPAAELKRLRERINASFQESAERMRKEEEDRYKPRTSRKTVGECACGGEVVRVTKTRYEMAVSIYEMRIGGSNPMRAIVETETYCKSCKLMYSNTGKIALKKKENVSIREISLEELPEEMQTRIAVADKKAMDRLQAEHRRKTKARKKHPRRHA